MILPSLGHQKSRDARPDNGAVAEGVRAIGEVDRIVECSLLGEAQDPGQTTEAVDMGPVVRRGLGAARRLIWRQPYGTLIVHRGETDLLQIVDALDPAGRLAGRLDGGQEQADQDSDDGDHDEELDQGESASSSS